MTGTPYGQTLLNRGVVLRHIRARVHQVKIRNWLIGAAALVLVLGGLWHFVNSNIPVGGRHRVAAPVRTAKVGRRDMAVVEHTLGTVVANATVQVTARVQGTLESVSFQEGQFVKKGDLLFQIDPRPFQAAWAQAEAIYRRDQAQLKNAMRDKERYATLRQQ